MKLLALDWKARCQARMDTSTSTKNIQSNDYCAKHLKSWKDDTRNTGAK